MKETSRPQRRRAVVVIVTEAKQQSRASRPPTRLWPHNKGLSLSPPPSLGRSGLPPRRTAQHPLESQTPFILRSSCILSVAAMCARARWVVIKTSQSAGLLPSLNTPLSAALGVSVFHQKTLFFLPLHGVYHVIHLGAYRTNHLYHATLSRLYPTITFVSKDI